MGQRLALLIATSRYADPRLRRLRAPAQEAQELGQLLLDPAIGGFDSAPVLIDATKARIERHIEELFRDREVDDLVLLYLSGHGIKNDHNRLFFAAYDTETDRPHSTAVPATLVHDLLEECQANKKAVLLDCCYSGIFSAGMTPKTTASVDLGNHLGRGSYVITASTELEFAYEDQRLVTYHPHAPQTYSAFTHAVITGLATGAAARDGKDIITAEDLYDYVHHEMRRVGARQTPTWSNQASGFFALAKARPGRLDGTGPSPTLVELLPADSAAPATDLVVPIGRGHQRRGPGADDVLRMDLAGQDGHVAIVGRIYSGKTTLLHTLLAGLAFNRPTTEIAFHCLDSAGRFSALADQPHVRTVLGPAQAREVARLLAHVEATIQLRDRLFRTLPITRLSQYRELCRRGLLPHDQHGDLFLVIDGWEQFAQVVPDFAATVRRIASTGLGFAVHVIVTARRWAELPDQLARLLHGRIELLLDDPAESKVDPELAASLPDRPGWGLFNGQRFLAALPEPAEPTRDDLDDLVAKLTSNQALILGAQTPAFPSPTADSRLDDPLSRDHDLFALLGLGDPASFDVADAQRPRPDAERLRVPIGVDAQGEPVHLDIKEAAMGGMGPHGMCIGATGSGKSELLRTLVLGLAATHSSAELNLVLADFKGGASFLGLERLPHTAAVITNLADDLWLVDRMSDALFGEIRRRQELLAHTGSKNIRDYQRQARQHRTDLPSLATLLVVVDEFAELLTSRPDFVQVFLHIGRVGRSLGVHLLLASQRLEEGKLRGLDSFLSYRIGLKTFSAAESRAAIGVPDAHELPPIPGSGYLKFGTEAMERFKAAYVSAPYRPAGAGEQTEADTGRAPTVLDVAVHRLAGHGGTPAHQVWLPPLDEPPALDTLLPPLAPTEDRGISPAGFFGNGKLQIPLGLVDRPFEQRRDLLWADFSGAAGHGAVVGGPQSGKSMLLRTIVASMALTHTPAEVQFYCLDLGGGTLAAFEALPHVGGFAGRLDLDKARRMVAELSTLIAEREARFRQHGIDSMTEFRNRKRRGELKDDPFGDVFLIVDGWMNFRQEFEALEAQVVRLAGQGLAYGVHVIITANRWAEIRPGIRDLLGTRFELRLGDPSESDIDRKVAVNVPQGRPGRGLTKEKLHFLTALPRIDASSDAANVAAGVQDLIHRVAGSWRGPVAPPVRLLPEMLPLAELTELTARAERGSGRLVPIGVNEDELAPVYLDFDAEPHFMAFADGESGKTNLLRVIIRGIAQRYTSSEALIMLVDYRRTLLGYIETDHLLGYAVSGTQLAEMAKDVRESMDKRLPGPDVTQQQLRNRSWWSGPELFVVVDDYDLVATAGNNPLAPLVDLLPQAKDVGLHLIVARRTGGASRAMYDPVLSRLREIAAPGLIMSGSRDEGVLLGNVRPSEQPPGRGVLVTRKQGSQRIQVAWTPEDDPPSPEVPEESEAVPDEREPSKAELASSKADVDETTQPVTRRG